MRIVITVDTYYPDSNGVQNVTQYQAEGLVDLGHNVTIVTSDCSGKYKKKELYHGVSIIRLNARNRNMFHWGNKKEFQKIILQLSKEADIIMGVCIESFAVDWLLPILDRLEAPVFVMNHGMHEFRWNRYNISSVGEVGKKILRDLRWGIFYALNWNKIRKIGGIGFLHEKDYAYIQFKKHGCSGQFIVYNAAAPAFFEMEGIRKEKLIINVGSFNSRKNQMLCLDAYYKANTGDYRLVLIGNPDNKYYKTLIKRKRNLDEVYGKKKVEILCNVNRDDTVEMIKKSSIYLMTSTWEAFPISVIEAMATSAMFISTNVGVNRYLPGGIVCNNETELINNLEKYTHCDNEKLRYNAGKYAELHFRQSKQIKYLEDCFVETIKREKKIV